MSSLADQIDAEDSSHSLLSRRQSEAGSRYVVESGVYMSSFAATVFVASLVTIGVLMATLLVALTVMLNSCQSRSLGPIEHSKTSDSDYCNVYAFHAELNILDTNEFPAVCKRHSLAFNNRAQFLRDLDLSVQLADNYFSTVEANDDHLDAIFMDIDDIFLPVIDSHNSSVQDWRKQVEHEHLAGMLVLRLFLKLRSTGWPVVLFTRNHSSYANDTIESLSYAGFIGWSSLIMRSGDAFPMESWDYISDRRAQLMEKGYRIAGIISSRMDAFRGSHLGRRNFKLPNPNWYNLSVPTKTY